MTASITARGAADRSELDALGPRLSLTLSPAVPAAGDTVTVTAAVTNDCAFTLRRMWLYVDGVAGRARRFVLGSLPPGGTATRVHRVTVRADAEGPFTVTGHGVFDVTGCTSDAVRSTVAFMLPYQSLRSAFNNVGIADDAKPAAADVDAYGSSLSAQALASVGCPPGAVVTHDGVRFTWPDVKPGERDNVVSSGQTLLLSGSGSRLAFLGTSTWGVGRGDGQLLYPDGSSQAFSVEVPDWYGSQPDAAIVAPYRNVAAGRDNTPVSLFFFAVPIQQGKQPRAVVLPNVSPDLRAGTPALHIFAMTLA